MNYQNHPGALTPSDITKRLDEQFIAYMFQIEQLYKS
jgi:hypothetical protein